MITHLIPDLLFGYFVATWRVWLDELHNECCGRLVNLVTGFTLHSPHSTASKLSSTELFCKQLLRGEINIHTAQANVWQVQQHKEVEN